MRLYHGSNMRIEEIDLKRGRRGKDFGQAMNTQEEQDRQFQIECLTNELVTMLMEENGMTMEQALDTVYRSHTYEKVERASTGLFYQGAVYVMDMLREELSVV